MLALCFNNSRTVLVYSLFVVALIVCGEFMMGSCFVMWYLRYLSCGMRFPTMWYVRPAKSQISLHIRAV